VAIQAVSRVSCSESIKNAEDSSPEVAQEAELSSPTTEVSNSMQQHADNSGSHVDL